MAEFRVRFVGDLGNLAAFNSAIRNSLSQNATALERAMTSNVSRSVGEQIRPAGSTGSGLFIKNATTQFDSLNKAIIQSGTLVRRYVTGYETEMKKVKDATTGVTYDKAFVRPIFGKAYHSDFKNTIQNMDAYNAAIQRLAPVETAMLNRQRDSAAKIVTIDNARSRLTRYALLPHAQQTTAGAESIYDQVRRLGITLPGGALDLIRADPKLPATGVQTVLDSLKQQRIAIVKGAQAEVRAIESDPVVKQLQQNVNNILTGNTGYMSTQSQQVLTSYPQIRRDLEKKAGLGGGAKFGTTPYNIAAQKSDFEITDVYRDMERGLVRVSGSIRGADNIMSQFSYTIDKNGNAVNSWGRQLSGSRGFLNQTTRDLVKAIEWTVAYSLVLGTLGIAFQSVSKINELNVNLQRFAITARLSSEELGNMFDGLTKVAYATATPIGELVKAADDMALATRRANQSTAEWQASMLELANAVGILTNISGLDTVKATELLVASMKQLSLTTKDLIPLLNQITAAAGGQSASITDIATALATLAEAAEQAGVGLTGQIAAVQVISQVTGKSAEQTATAFKNLFGAINADTSVKKLAEFGIAVRDANGDLRPFLEIYKDIADAIRTGIIPHGRVNEVLRAISGGRTSRQADTAALIANIYKVFEVEGIAANASNEALIANAKILDTNQAKITRFQNAFDKTIFDKFNKTIADLTGVLANFGIIFAKVFGAIPDVLVSITIQLLALVSAAKLLGRVGAALGLGGLLGGKKGPLSTAITQGGAGAPQKSFTLLSSAQQDQYMATMFGTSRRTLTNIIDSANVPAPKYGFVLPKNGYTTDLRTSLGFRQPVTSSPYVSPFTPIRDPISAPYGDPDLTTRYNTSPYAPHRNQFGAIQYIPSYNPLSRDTIPGLRETGVSSSGSRSFEPGVNLSAAEVSRRIGNISLAPETKSILSRFIGIFGRAAGTGVGKLGIGAAAGAAAATGGDDFASLAQAAGTGLLFVPGAQLVGAGLIAGSALIQKFNEGADEAKKKALDLQSTIYNLTLQWKQDQASVDAATTAYNKVNEGLNSTEAQLRKTKEGTKEYADLQDKLKDSQSQLGEASVDLALALNTQREGVEGLRKALEDLALITGDKSFANYISNLASGPLTKDQINELVGAVSKNILEAAGQPVYQPSVVGFNPATLNYGQPTNEGITTYRPNFLTGAPDRVTVTAGEFRADPSLLQNFLAFLPSVNGIKQFGPESFPFTNPLAIQAFREQADTYRQTLSPSEQQSFRINVIDPFNEAVNKFALAGTVIDQSLKNATANLEARQLLGVIYGEKATSATSDITVAAALNKLQNSPDAFIRPPSPAELRERIPTRTSLQSTSIISELIASSQTGELNKQAISGAAEEYLKSLRGLDPNKSAFDEISGGIELVTAKAEIMRRVFGLTDEQIIAINGSLGNLKTAASEALEQMIADTQKWGQEGLQSVGQKLLDLQARMQGGEFKDNKALGTALKKQFDALAVGYATVTKNSVDLENALGNNAAKGADILLQHLNALNINGFQGIEASIDSLNGALFNFVMQLNLTGPQIAKIIGLWGQAMLIIQKLAVIPVGRGFLGAYDAFRNALGAQLDDVLRQIKSVGGQGAGTGSLSPVNTGGSTGSVNALYLNEEQQKLADPVSLVKQAYQDALKLQAQIPGETKANRNSTVVVFDELQKIFTARGVSEELLRRALDNLTGAVNEANQKADTVRRIRVGAGDFSAIANVPVNLQSGVSVGANNQINITFNLGGTNLTPAQFNLFANQIASEIARRL